MTKYVCPICGYVHEGNEPPEKCPQCGCAGAKFLVKEATDKMTWACEHEIGVAKGLDAIPDLAPGDFRTVRQAMFYLDGVADNAIRLGALEKEAAVKRQGRVTAPVGFSAA